MLNLNNLLNNKGYVKVVHPDGAISFITRINGAWSNIGVSLSDDTEDCDEDFGDSLLEFIEYLCEQGNQLFYADTLKELL